MSTVLLHTDSPDKSRHPHMTAELTFVHTALPGFEDTVPLQWLCSGSGISTSSLLVPNWLVHPVQTHTMQSVHNTHKAIYTTFAGLQLAGLAKALLMCNSNNNNLQVCQPMLGTY